MSWADIYPWSPPEPGEPVVRRLYDQVRGAILSGALKPGGRLPSSRDFSTRLGVARASVVAAYDLLLAEGYAEGRAGSGTYVSADLSGMLDVKPQTPAPSARPPRIPARARVMDELTFPTPQAEPRLFTTGRTLLDARALDAWSASTRRALRTLGPVHFGYSDAAGEAPLRAAIADYLRAARGVICTPDQVIVTSGAQHAVDIAVRLLLHRGDSVWMEDPGYPATLHALTVAGVAIHHVPVDRSGLVVARGVAVAPEARVAFVTPSHQYPLGVTLSMARRLELLAWAREAGAWIVEDDYASEFRYAGPPLASLQGLDGGERVIYVGTLNKALFPGLRMGYAVVPKALATAFANARQVIDRQPPTLTQAIVLDFMREGQFAAHIRRRRLTDKGQRDALASALTDQLSHLLEVDVPDQGMHLIAYLKDGRSDLEVEAAAAEAGLYVRAISRLYRQVAPRQGLMLGFSGFPARLMAGGVARLAKVLG
ncbi:PLP-dependent aminotransferase family protein [Phenylobacterium sp.]|uniref:MocR-like pyridoxine biosynthesis transcription factor PdxR n=1 Tax=Phenylobacterium sp. TaxID=1871053 RepID=UPI00286B29B1|nr:PLP-dependent aminotransferase family protein [Phenylobacterium sp.]